MFCRQSSPNYRYYEAFRVRFAGTRNLSKKGYEEDIIHSAIVRLSHRDEDSFSLSWNRYVELAAAMETGNVFTVCSSRNS